MRILETENMDVMVTKGDCAGSYGGLRGTSGKVKA